MVHGFLFGIGFLLAIAFFPTILRAAGVEIKIAIILLAGATAVVGLLWLVGSYQWIADIWIGIVILFWGALIGTWLVGEGRKKNYSPMLCVCGAVLAIGVATYYDGRSHPTTLTAYILFLLGCAMFFVGGGLALIGESAASTRTIRMRECRRR